MPGSRPPADQLYEHLLQLHDDTFDAECYELSYHVLAAALRGRIVADQTVHRLRDDVANRVDR